MNIFKRLSRMWGATEELVALRDRHENLIVAASAVARACQKAEQERDHWAKLYRLAVLKAIEIKEAGKREKERHAGELLALRQAMAPGRVESPTQGTVEEPGQECPRSFGDDGVVANG